MTGDVRMKFSGHETFPLRYGWLKKVVDALSNAPGPSEKNIFKSKEAISYLGVGKNMLSSMRHWALSCDVININNTEGFNIGEIGEFLFSESIGVDPYLEKPGSLWLLHWKLTSRLDRSTTWHFAYHHFARKSFDRQALVSEIKAFCLANGKMGVADKTLQRDADCFIKTYVLRPGKAGRFGEETLECPLTELRLASETFQKGIYEFQIGPKPSLPNAVFQYALREFAGRSAGKATFSLEQVTYDPGSPGRAFKLDENSVAARLADIDATSDGVFGWTETAGLRQVQRIRPEVEALELLSPAYARSPRKQKAA